MTGQRKIILNNFLVTSCDTDSVFFKKQNGEFFTKQERELLLNQLNSLMPAKIHWELNDYFSLLITLKAKNYIMINELGETKYKGSSLKSSKLELATKEFLYKIIDSIIKEEYNYSEIYNSYVKEILNLKDIKRWATKKTITEKVLNGTRTNETKVMDAIENIEYSEGDKLYLYYDINDNLKLVENYNNDHNVTRLLKRLYDTSKIFNNIIPKETFPNLALKRNKEILNGLS